jgi:hypothetical protein
MLPNIWLEKSCNYYGARSNDATLLIHRQKLSHMRQLKLDE